MEDTNSLNEKKYVVFTLDRELYGMNIEKILTIENLLPMTRVPNTLDMVKGVINLRGEIIPIIDLRKVFKLEIAEDTEDTRIIIIKANEIFYGFIADLVEEVISLKENEILNPQSVSTTIAKDYVLGICKYEDNVVTIIDSEKISMIPMVLEKK